MNNRFLGYAILIALLAGGGIFLLLQSSGSDVGGVSPEAADVVADAHRPDFSLPDLDGRMRSISEWDGKVVLVNFWATWCPPCRREIPGFIEVRNAYADQGFEIIGVAIDQPDKIRSFVDSIGINYPVLYGQADANQVAVDYGDTMNTLPYSALLDREGNIRFSGAGGLTRESLEKAVKSLL
jgi:peroxiredoxin